MNNKKEVIISAVAQVLALVNLVLSAMGKSPLPISSETVSLIIGGAIALGISAWNYWKNHNITTASQKGQEIVDLIKQGKVELEQIEDVIDMLKKEGVKVG